MATVRGAGHTNAEIKTSYENNADTNEYDDAEQTKLAGIATSATALTLGTPVAATSGTAIDFTNIPAGTKRIAIQFVSVSTNGTSGLRVQIGDAGGVEVANYAGGVAVVSAGTTAIIVSNGMGLTNTVAAGMLISGSVVLTLENAATFTWVATSVLGRVDAEAAYFGGGSKSLSAELDRVRITTAGGTDVFDAGEINITYE